MLCICFGGKHFQSFPKCRDENLVVCGVKSLLVYLRQILRKNQKLKKLPQKILWFLRVWDGGQEVGGAGEHGFYFRMLIIKQPLEIMCLPTQNAYNAVLQFWNKAGKQGMWSVGEN